MIDNNNTIQRMIKIFHNIKKCNKLNLDIARAQDRCSEQFSYSVIVMFFRINSSYKRIGRCLFLLNLIVKLFV